MQFKSFSIGIDIGGTNTTFGLVNRRGEILIEGAIKTKIFPSPQLLSEALYEKLYPHINEVGVDNIAGIGIGAPNANYYTGEIVSAPNLPWKNTVNMKELVSAIFNLPVIITNDANATAIGEMIYGAAKGMKDFIVITLGTGVGSGIVVNGNLVYGHDGFAGELGHVIVVPNGRSCGCGRNGCLETYASATGIVKTASEKLNFDLTHKQENHNPNSLQSIWRKNNKISATDIYNAALHHDPLALEIFEETGRILGMALANAAAFSNPQAFILFGGLAKSGDFILKPTKAHMEANLLSVYKNKIAIIPSAFTEKNAALLGTSALAWDITSVL